MAEQRSLVSADSGARIALRSFLCSPPKKNMRPLGKTMPCKCENAVRSNVVVKVRMPHEKEAKEQLAKIRRRLYMIPGGTNRVSLRFLLRTRRM